MKKKPENKVSLGRCNVNLVEVPILKLKITEVIFQDAHPFNSIFKIFSSPFFVMNILW